MTMNPKVVGQSGVESRGIQYNYRINRFMIKLANNHSYTLLKWDWLNTHCGCLVRIIKSGRYVTGLLRIVSLSI